MDNPKGMHLLIGGSLLLAVLQSVCTAVLTISGIRLAIGLSVFVLSGSIFAPIRIFHQDAIRIPMLTLAAAGAIVNLLVLAWIWRRRAEHSAQGRKRERSNSERRSNKVQVVLAVLTLMLVGLEIYSHSVMIHHAQPDPTTQSSR